MAILPSQVFCTTYALVERQWVTFLSRLLWNSYHQQTLLWGHLTVEFVVQLPASVERVVGVVAPHGRDLELRAGVRIEGISASDAVQAGDVFIATWPSSGNKTWFIDRNCVEPPLLGRSTGCQRFFPSTSLPPAFPWQIFLASHFCSNWLSRLGFGNLVGSTNDHLQLLPTKHTE